VRRPHSIGALVTKLARFKPTKVKIESGHGAERDRAGRLPVAKDDALLRASTISDYLAYLNTPERYRINHQWDVMSNLAPGEGPEHAKYCLVDPVPLLR
jgi:hypothetical protein